MDSTINAKNVVEKERDVDYIAQAILEEAKIKQSNNETKCHDLVAAIHSLWMEVGLLLGKEMRKLRSREREYGCQI